jgi:hypothetical protein
MIPYQSLLESLNESRLEQDRLIRAVLLEGAVKWKTILNSVRFVVLSFATRIKNVLREVETDVAAVIEAGDSGHRELNNVGESRLAS